MGALDLIALWLHLVSAAVWVGGIIFLGAVLQPVSKKLIQDPIERSRFVGNIGAQFNVVGWGSLIILSLTGFYNLVRVAGGFNEIARLLLKTNYGMILDTKLTFVLAMILITAHHTFIAGPKVRKLILQLENAEKESADAKKLQTRINKVQKENGFLMGLLTLCALATLFFATLLVAPL